MSGNPFLFAAVILVAANVSVAQTLEERLGNQAWMDWGRFVVRVSGSSAALVPGQNRQQRIDALQAAKIAAAENLWQAVEKLAFNSNTTVAGQMNTSSLLKSKVLSYAKRFTVTDTRSMSDMTVEVEVELPVAEGLAQLFFPDVTGTGKFRLDDIPRSPLSLLPWPECRVVPEGIELVVPSKGLTTYDGKVYTGLVVDARGFGVKPAMQARVLDPDGREVYGLNYVQKEAVASSSIVTYHLSMNEALRDPRAGKMPFVVCAEATAGQLQADVVVSANDAVLIHSAAVTRNFLKDGRVVMVIGPKN